ncbi:uncharacterized protein LOC119094579 [Pollicipes pollicipes]|uniref:uncharacterized protein LOC119094579 n=1 Tax=Pollicipes pollicipes TaxID=41117 RepID=UPI0018851108|nr:uncharacterized protein LOC119094579 [Pollicipes pollicipes]
MAADGEGDDTRTARVLAALSFAVTVIAVGVPVWLKTTEIYRAGIPHEGIDSLQRLTLDVSTGAQLEVVALATADATRLAAGLERHLDGVSVSGRAASEAEAAALTTAADPWAADDALNSGTAIDRLRVVVLPPRPAAAAAATVLLGRHADVLVTPTAEAAPLAAVLRAVAFGPNSEAVSTRRVRSAPAYDLLVSVVVPQPEGRTPLWDGAAATRHLLAPVLERLRPLANLTVKSQHLYHAGLGVVAARDATSGEHFLSEEQLSLVITPLEARLGAAVSGRPTLQFVVFVPPPGKRPLVYNPAPGPAGLRSWELVSLRRRRTVENVENARRNLASLAAMLDQISNIVIDDAVGAAVAEGVAAAEEAARQLAAGREAEAYVSSCRALARSERAIFDPSMLALLYFPDDQKYAIYIPLFLPVSIPVLMSLRTIWAWARGAPEKVKGE